MEYFYGLDHFKEKPNNHKFILKLFLILIVEILFLIVIHQYIPRETLTHNKNHTNLILVQILFRHGERTPLIGRSYPKDPYINQTFEPYGAESLTSKGEHTMYKLGKLLKRYYGEFFGEYESGVVYARSSPLIRCRNSLALVLAALFPPKKERQLGPDLKWLPIEMHYDPFETDLGFYSVFNCPKYVNLREAESQELLNDLIKSENITELINYLEEHTGIIPIKSMFPVLIIYDVLVVQKELGLELPKWTETVFPDLLWKYGYQELKLISHSDDLKRLAVGFLLREMLATFNAKVNNVAEKTRKKKIYLYSGHDYNIFSFFAALGIVLSTRPNYGSFVALELHKIKNQYQIKVVYHNYEHEIPQILKLPECEELCPIKKFIQLYQKYEAMPNMCNTSN